MNSKTIETGILVAGGGPAGVCAALAAARAGAKVVLCQNRSVLGGNASSEIRMHIVGADSNGYRCDRALEVEAREGGLIEELRLRQAVENPARSPHGIDMVLYDMIRQEPNLELLLDTHVHEAVVKDNRIVHVRAERPAHEEVITINARYFIDASGDSRMAVSAGNPYRVGREAREEFEEPHALAQADREVLGSTILFQARNMGRPVSFRPPPWARKFTEHDLRKRNHFAGKTEGGEAAALSYGFWWLEWGGHLDTITDNDIIRHELLAIAYGVWDHLKNGGDHGADNWVLTWVGMLPGKRESRRLTGRVVLTENDVVQARDWPDAVAYGGWYIDLHPPRGVDDPDAPACTHIPVSHLYSIPLRCTMSPNIDNLLFAGRNLSATHVAFASTRVMATCGVIGQAAGIAAAHAVREGLDNTSLLQPEAVRAVQQAILKQDCFIIGIGNEDPNDLARAATVTASSERPEGPASAVLDGVTRSVHGERGVKPGQSVEGTHRWMSVDLPAWLELVWDEPVEIEEVLLTFDTGLHRWLSLTQHDLVHETKNIWGPQPETVREYQLTASLEGEATQLAAVQDNYLRQRIHRFSPRKLNRLRLEVRSAHALDHARVLEMRCYGPAR